MLGWLSLMLSEAPGEPSVRRHVFAAAFLLAVGMCVADFRWPMSDNAKNLATAVFTIAAGAATAGRFAEAREK